MRFESGNVPRGLSDTGADLIANQIGVGAVAFTPTGGWVLLAENGKVASEGVWKRLLTAIENQRVQGATISCIAIGPKGEQVVLCTDQQSAARSITADHRDWIDSWDGGSRTVSWTAFDGAGWVVVGSDGEIRSHDINDNCLQAMYNLSQTAPIDAVAFDGRGGWVVAAGAHVDSEGIDDDCLSTLQGFIADGDGIDGITLGSDPGVWAVWSNHTIGPATDPMRQIEAELDLRAEMDRENNPGLAIAVVVDGEIAHEVGYGWLTAGGNEAVHPGSVFQAASISKTVNALGILKLVDNGVIALDDSVRSTLNWDLPDTTGAVADHEITYRQLLSHTAGTSTHGFDGYPSGSTLPTILETLDGTGPANNDPVELFKDPGAQQDYSGGGSTMLQRLVEELTGDNYADWMLSNVLTPIRMRSSTFALGPPNPPAAGVASAHEWGEPIEGDRNDYPESAAAGLYTTVVDLCSVIQTINNGGDGFIAESLMTEMLTPVLGNGGLGCFTGTWNGMSTWTHNGVNRGFRTEIFGIPEINAGLVVMVNSPSEKFKDDIVAKIKDVFGW